MFTLKLNDDIIEDNITKRRAKIVALFHFKDKFNDSGAKVSSTDNIIDVESESHFEQYDLVPFKDGVTKQ